MCEVRMKALLQDFTDDFELLLAQHHELNQRNNSLTLEVARLKARLWQSEAEVIQANERPGKKRRIQPKPLFFKPPTPRSHKWDFELPPLTPKSPSLYWELGPVTPPGEETEPDAETNADDDGAALENVGKSRISFEHQSEQGGLKPVGPRLNAKKSATSVLTQGSLRRAIQLWPAWQDQNVLQSGSGVRLVHSVKGGADPEVLPHEKNLKYGADIQSTSFLQVFVARPTSPRQMLWDVLTAIFMSIDVMLVPMQAFAMPDTDAMKLLDWATVIFWTLDIPNNFFMGFHKQGVFEMRPSKIAKRYAKHLLPLDFAVIVADWIVTLSHNKFGENIGFVRIVKASRITRLLRLLRIIRIAKVVHLAMKLSDWIAFFHSDSIKVLIDISRVFVFILVSSHFLACGWYAIGTMSQLGEDGVVMNHWVEKFIVDQGGDPSLAYRYMTSLHWSLTQFTPASMEIVPRNAVERIYAIAVLLLAVVAFSSFVSSITSSMTRLRMINFDRSKQRDDISRYILEHRMSLSVGNRIMHVLMKQDSMLPPRVREQDVSLLKSLPDALRIDMHREIFLPVLCPHPFFHHYNEFLDDASLATICHTAMQECSSAKGEYVFSWGETATHMFFIQQGACEYSIGAALHKDAVKLEDTGMLAEAVLWVEWEHMGYLIALEHVDFATLDSTVMQGILSGQPAAKAARAYALQFLEDLLMQGNYTDLCTEMDKALEMAQIAWVDIEHQQNLADRSSMVRVYKMTRFRGFIRSLRQTLRI